MSDQKDDSSGAVLMLLSGVIGLVLAGVLGLAVVTAKRHGSEHGGLVEVPTIVAPALAEVHELRIDFGPGSSALPLAASGSLVQIADAARAAPGSRLTINGEGERALAVRHALEADGVAADLIAIEPALPASGGANQVEVHLR